MSERRKRREVGISRTVGPNGPIIGTIYIYIYIKLSLLSFYKIFEIHVKYHYKHNGNRKEHNQGNN
jgi:hypothetical protein